MTRGLNGRSRRLVIGLLDPLLLIYTFAIVFFGSFAFGFWSSQIYGKYAATWALPLVIVHIGVAIGYTDRLGRYMREYLSKKRLVKLHYVEPKKRWFFKDDE